MKLYAIIKNVIVNIKNFKNPNILKEILMGNVIDLSTAIENLTLTVRYNETKTTNTPFFFIIGAGVSAPSVPLARNLEKELSKQLKSQKIDFDPQTDDPMKRYSALFHKAIPDPSLRQIFLRDKIKDKPISYANFRLAHILASRKISNLVITPNFDDHLFRALSMFGIHPVISDHPLTARRLQPQETHELQILHVHGTYQFYDCCNLDIEMESRKNSDMMFFVSNLMVQRSPIVIGYSGWENDIIMNSIKRRIEAGSFISTAYWFCYKNNDYENLPKWLKEAENINFVVPPPSDESQNVSFIIPLKENKPKGTFTFEDNAEPITAQVNFEIDGKSVKFNEIPDQYIFKGDINSLPSHIGKKMNPLYIQRNKNFFYDADTVLNELISSLNIPAPNLFTDPISHLIDVIDNSAPTSLEFDPRDIYNFGGLLRKLRRGRDLLNQADISSIDNALDLIKEATQQANFTQSISIAMEVLNNPTLANELSVEDWQMILGPIQQALKQTEGNNAVQLRACMVIIRVAKRLHDKNIQFSTDIIGDHLFKAATLNCLLSKYKEGIKLFDIILTKHKPPKIDNMEAMAIVNKGAALFHSGDNDKAIEQFRYYITNNFEPDNIEDYDTGLCFCYYFLGLIHYSNNSNLSHEYFTKFIDLIDLAHSGPPIKDLSFQMIADVYSNEITFFIGQKKTLAATRLADQLWKVWQLSERDIQEIIFTGFNDLAYHYLLTYKEKLSTGSKKPDNFIKKAEKYITYAHTIEKNSPIILGNKSYIEYLSGNLKDSQNTFNQAYQIGKEELLNETLLDIEKYRIPNDQGFLNMINSIILNKN